MVMTLAWRRKDGRCRAAGRVGVSEHGCLSLLMRLLLVAGLRKAVAADSCLHGFAENMNPPYHHGDLVGRGGGKQKREVAGAGDPWPFQGGASKPKQDEKIPCCNPRCPGIGGKQSFKYKHAVGRGQHGFHCMACNMPWQRSWEVHFNGRPPPWQGAPMGRTALGR